MEDHQPLSIAAIRGADPKTPHPVQRFCRGVGNVARFAVEAAAAFLELFWPPRDVDGPVEKSRRPHPVEKSAPFPIND